MKTRVQSLFRVDLTEGELRQFEFGTSAPVAATVKATPILTVSSAPKPWGRNA